jgi:hypothetical protein
MINKKSGPPPKDGAEAPLGEEQRPVFLSTSSGLLEFHDPEAAAQFDAALRVLSTRRVLELLLQILGQRQILVPDPRKKQQKVAPEAGTESDVYTPPTVDPTSPGFVPIRQEKFVFCPGGKMVGVLYTSALEMAYHLASLGHDLGPTAETAASNLRLVYFPADGGNMPMSALAARLFFRFDQIPFPERVDIPVGDRFWYDAEKRQLHYMQNGVTVWQISCRTTLPRALRPLLGPVLKKLGLPQEQLDRLLTDNPNPARGGKGENRRPRSTHTA